MRSLPLASIVALALLSGCAAPARSAAPLTPLPQDTPVSGETAGESGPAQEEAAGETQGGGYPLDIPKRLVERPAELDIPHPDDSAKPGEWLVAPVPFFSEQIGWGLALWAGYIFQIDPESPPSSAGVGGMYSENDSNAVVAAFTPRFGEDDWRMTLVGGAASMRYDFYGIGNEAGEEGIKVPFVSEGDFARLEVLHSVGENAFFGPRMTLTSVETDIRGPDDQVVDILDDELDAQDLQLGLRLMTDTRDNTFFPRSGRLGDLTVDVSSEEAGSDFGYESYSANLSVYSAVTESSVLAWRVLAEYAGGDTPFFFLPTHRMLGYEAGRYRDRFWTATEAEYRIALGGRLGMALFAGFGAVGENPADISGSDVLPSGGVGLRIRLTEENPVDYRIDVATGAGDEVILYLSAGQAF